MAGKVVHFEIPVDEGDRAVAFYGDAFGWLLEREGPLAYWTTTAGEGEGIGGALTQRDPQAPGLSLYIEVEDIDESLSAIESAGGRPLSGRLPIPTVGWTAFFADTEGNRLGLFQADTSAGADMGIQPSIG
jgi:predicted enzyme related to lactoylglutathione lyase